MALLNISFGLSSSICLPLSGGPCTPSPFLINQVASGEDARPVEAAQGGGAA